MWVGHFHTALASLRASKTRSLLTMLGIIIGICSVVTMVSIGEGLKHQIVGSAGSKNNVITVRSGKLLNPKSQSGLNLLAFFSASTLTQKDAQTISRQKNVAATVPFDFLTNSVSGNNQHADNVYVVGTSPDLPQVLGQKVEYGQFFTADDDGQNFAVIGSNLAQQMFGVFNPVGSTISISGQDYVVRGVLSHSSGGLLSVAQIDFGSSVFIPFDNAKSLAVGHTNILQILAQVRDPKKINQTASAINLALTKNHGTSSDFTVLKQDQLLKLAGGLVNSATGFISGIAAISLLVAGIGIMDIMLVSVSERTREIGLRKAIGATDSQILQQFLTEGLVITAGGGLIGIAASILVNIFLRVETNWQPIISWLTVVAAVVVSVGVGVIFSIAPALKAARKNPIDALRVN